jgi:hydrogenase expression/formation protein HypC
MCLAIPARVDALLENDQALIDLDGVQKEISLALLDGVRVGDYVVVHVGYALGRVDPAAAARTLELLRGVSAAAEPAP